MVTLNERIKEVRKDLGLSQKELAERIGISQRSVSWGEQPGNNVPDSTIKALCMAFRISESWLRDGTGPMYEQQSTFSLDQFVKEHGATGLELEVLKAYFELDPEIRRTVFDHFRARLSQAGAPAEGPPVVDDQGKYISSSVEQAEEAYKKSVLTSARNTGSSASSITEGTEAGKASNE